MRKISLPFWLSSTVIDWMTFFFSGAKNAMNYLWSRGNPSYNDLYKEAPPARGTFFPLQVPERVRTLHESKYIRKGRKICHLGGSIQFPALIFGWVVITTLYHLMLQPWYQKTAESLVNTLSSFF